MRMEEDGSLFSDEYNIKKHQVKESLKGQGPDSIDMGWGQFSL